MLLIRTPRRHALVYRQRAEHDVTGGSCHVQSNFINRHLKYLKVQCVNEKVYVEQCATCQRRTMCNVSLSNKKRTTVLYEKKLYANETHSVFGRCKNCIKCVRIIFVTFVE